MKGEQFQLNVSPIEGVIWLGKRGKLSPIYILGDEVLKCDGEVSN